MIPRSLILSLLFLIHSLSASEQQNASASQSIPLLPTEAWNIQTVPGDEATLTTDHDILTLTFRVNITNTILSGHITNWWGHVDLLLANPISIPTSSSLERICLEASGLTLAQEKIPTKIAVLPILRDRDGELFYYFPSAGNHLMAGSKGWSLWQTTSFYAGEAGAAAQEIYYVGGKLVNAWPDGDLEFMGFRVEVRESATGAGGVQAKAPANGLTRTGTIRIASAAFTPLILPTNTPFFFAGNVLSKKGNYRFCSQIRNEFQSAPIYENIQPIPFDPENPATTRQRLSFPLGGEDNYWIRYRITAEDGSIASEGNFRSQIQGTKATAVSAVNRQTPPAIGFLRVNELHPTHGVYELVSSMPVTIRVFPAQPEDSVKNDTPSKTELLWRLTPVSNGDQLSAGEIQIAFSGKEYTDVILPVPVQPGRDAYKLHLQYRRAGILLDTQDYLLGVKTDPGERHDRAGSLTDRKNIHRHAYFRTSFVAPRRTPQKPLTETEDLKAFQEYAENITPLSNALTYPVDLKDLEVLPGVFDFALLDRIMDAAADAGCKVNVRVAHADEHGNNLYTWQKYYRQINYDGTEAGGHSYYGAYAVTDPRVTGFWLDSYQALYRRYQKHTAFEGYYVMLPGGEWTVVDQPWAAMCTGYDPAAILSFRNWLQNQGLNLAGLNARWKTSYRNWEEVQLPLPDFRAGSAPDLRMSWIDFCRFKTMMARDLWFPAAVKAIRSYDTRNVITIYGAPKNYRNLDGLLDYCHNGGNHYGHDLNEYIKAGEQGGIGWITEPHHPHRWAAYGDPAQKGWVLDWSVWIMLAQAAGAGANLHVYFMPNPTQDLAKHYGGSVALDRMQLYRPILEELRTLKLEEPQREVALLTDEMTLYCKHRTTFNARLLDLRRWFDLTKTDSVFAENFDPENADHYKLLLPNILDEVMTAENLQRIERGVRKGGKAVIAANTGNYVPERGQEPFALLRALGITPPTAAYQLTDTGAAVIAKVSAPADNPLNLTQDQPIPFFTLARLSEDLASDAVKRDFWQYPYRWIPQTNYFGFYPGVPATDGQVLARFADGGAALSLHKVGQGEVLVFWGTPDMSAGRLKGFMAKVAAWAGVKNPRADSPIPNTLEGRSDALGRRYALLYQETPGSYTQKLLSIPDGRYFLDDLVSGQKLGVYEGKELRERGLPLLYTEGYSPLKIIRMIPSASLQASWGDKYRLP